MKIGFMVKKSCLALLTACAVLVCLLLGSVKISAVSPTIIKKLQVEYMTDPIGIDVEQPVFSWQMESQERGQKQTAYRIMVSSSAEKLAAEEYDMWDSTKIESDQSNGILYNGIPLSASTRYYWKVVVWDKEGAAIYSAEEAFFETGLMSSGWSGAKWIGVGDTGASEPASEPVYKFSIQMDFKVEETAFGLVFGGMDDTHYFMWQINTNGPENPGPVKLRPHRANGGALGSIGTDTDLTAGYPDIAAKIAGETWQRIKLEVDNGVVKTYIGDVSGAALTLINTYDVGERIDLGKIGFRQAAETAVVDNIVVKNEEDSGKILFEENFDNGRNLYFETGTIVDGALRIVLYSGSPVFQKNSAEVETPKFTIEMDFNIINTSFDFIFGAEDRTNFYMWQVHSSEQSKVMLRPHQSINDNVFSLDNVDLSHKYPDASSVVGKWVHIKIDVDHGVVKTYLDGDLCDTRTLPAFDLGWVGFRALASTYSVDNFIIRANGETVFSDDFNDPRSANFLGGSVSNGVYTTRGETAAFQAFGDIDAAPMLRKEFHVAKTVKSARLYATAAGIYEMFINGKRVGDSYLNPGSTQFEKHVLYQTYDVTDMLDVGANAIGGILGHGFYNGAHRNFGDELGLYAKLVITYTDNTSDILVTDESWKYTGQGPIIADDLFQGEKYDATREIDGWNLPGFDASSWYNAGVKNWNDMLGEGGEIMSQNMPPIKSNITLHPIAMTEPEPGVYVYDFGQNFAGIPRVKACGTRGDKMRLRYAELITPEGIKHISGSDLSSKPGNIMTDNLASASNLDIYTFKGNPDGEVFEPSLVYHGFRYLEISGIDEPLPLEDIEGLVLYSALDETSSFTSSDPLVNQLYSNVLWGQRSNFMSIPTDCPQRDERWGWTGDAQIFARTAAYNMNVLPFFRKYAMDMRDARHDNGIINVISPATGKGQKMDDFPTNGWGDAIIIIPWQMYMQYGDKQIIEENYDAMCAWIDILLDASKGYYDEASGTYKEGSTLTYIRSRGNLGDWLSTGETTPVNVTDTAYSAYVSGLLSKMAKITGRPDDAGKYADIAQRYKTAWQNEFLNADGSTKCGTQTSYVVGLQFDLFKPEHRKLAADRLAENIKKRGYHLTTGFLGNSYLTSALTEAGREDMAFILFEQTSAPSWMYSVLTGATTVWESWTALQIDQNDGTSTMDAKSYNHYAYGAVFEWVFKQVLGIERDENDLTKPAFKHILLQPTPGGGLTEVKGSYESIYGKITSHWTITDTGMEYSATVPANTTATVYLPISDENDVVLESGREIAKAEGVTYKGSENGRAIYEVVSGSYRFTVNSGEDGGEKEPADTGVVTAAAGTGVAVVSAAGTLWALRRRKRRAA